MSLSRKQRERLEHLVVVLEGVREEKKPFNIGAWVASPKDKGTHFKFRTVGKAEACGTAACAFGYAALDEGFQKQGLRMKVEYRVDREDVWKTKSIKDIAGFNKIAKASDGMVDATPKFKDVTGIEAGALFFGISERASRYLFMPCQYDVAKVTPAMVVKRVKEILKHDGLTADEAKHAVKLAA